MIGTAAVQAAIYTRLVSAAIVGSGRVVDGLPSDPASVGYPFIQIGETQTLDDDVTGRAGAEEYLTLHIWSRYRGQEEVKTIAGMIGVALHASTIAVEGFASVHVFVSEFRTIEDPDGLTRHGIVTLRINAFGQ